MASLFSLRMARVVCAFTTCFLLFTLSLPGGAQGQNISDIEVEGNLRIDDSTVISYMPVQTGAALTDSTIDQIIRTLFRTGFFSDVQAEQQGSRVIVRVVENPLINEVAFEGNRQIEDEVLVQEVNARSRQIYSPASVHDDVGRVIQIYQSRGRFDVEVTPQLIELDNNRVNLVFEIDEGGRTGIADISFVGNAFFSDRDLRAEISTKETAWWRFFQSSDIYDPQRLQFDEELLRRFYVDQGFADINILSSTAELSPEGDAFFLTFNLEEGDRYRFGEISISSSIPGVDSADYEGLIESESGDWYSADDVEDTLSEITDALILDGVPFVDVFPEITRDRAADTISIHYDLREGARIYVERIDIIGNVRTQDNVIRREMTLEEGDPFNSTQLQDSERRIRNLGYFEVVNADVRPGSAADKVVIQIEVAETSTGDFMIGAGYSSVEGFLANVSIRERNLLGRGQNLVTSVSLSGDDRQFRLQFTEPYFLGYDLSAGFDLFRTIEDNQDTRSYDVDRTGGGLQFGFPLGPDLRQRVYYRFVDSTIENVDNDASRFIRDQEGERVTSLIGHALTYDRLDNRLSPREGFLIEFGNEFAGLGGDVEFFQTTASVSYYTPIFTEDVILKLSANAGYIMGLNDQDVGISDRFFVGGRGLRGFEPAGIGPRDRDDALGGNAYATGTVEMSFPIGLPDEVGIRGRLFSDFGTVGELDESGIDDSHHLRMSVGVGLSWDTPAGPLRLDFAIPVAKEDEDKEERFIFSIGTSF